MAQKLSQPPEPPRTEEVSLDVTPGALYAGNNTRPGARKGCTYRVLGVAWCVRAMRDEVVYEGIDGPDCGRLFVAPAAVLAAKMVPVVVEGGEGAPTAAAVVGEGDVPVPPVGVAGAVAPPAKEIDLTTKGSGR